MINPTIFVVCDGPVLAIGPGTSLPLPNLALLIAQKGTLCWNMRGDMRQVPRHTLIAGYGYLVERRILEQQGKVPPYAPGYAFTRDQTFSLSGDPD